MSIRTCASRSGAGVLASRLAGRELIASWWTSRRIRSVSYLGERGGVPYPHCYRPIIRRNTPLPLTRTEPFIDEHPYQTEVDIKVYQGDDDDALKNIPVGDFRVVVVLGVVVRRRAVGGQVDGQAAVVVDRVAQHGVAGAALDGDAVLVVVGNRVRRARVGIADAVVVAVDVHAGPLVAQVERSGLVGADRVAEDLVAGGVGEIDAGARVQQ